ncbi:MAG: FISUMP domain-containing protein [Candidatus Saccharibacteria bacterium]|nr:FISUMP domain-containing protein [Candidatus Saccharibacteria bacterium]
MGQTSNKHYRVGESSDGDFLSPAIGTFTSPIKFLPYMVGVFGLAFLASCITASIMTPVQNSDATTQVDIHSNQVAYFVNIATAGSTISKDVQATYTGTLGIIPDTLTVTSNTPDGYKVYLSMAHDDSVASKQRLVNTTDSSSYFNPISSGSLSAPSNLSTANTWGVAVASTYNSAFDNATAYTDATVSQTTKFAPVPAYGHEELLITRTGDTTTQDGTGTTDTIPVYYGYHANSALPSGTYSNTVMYTAYAEASSEAEKTAIISPSKVDSYKTPQRLSFTTTLYTDRTIASNQASVKINDLDCTDVQVSKVGGGNDTVTISCLAPAQTRPGTYSVIVSVPDYGHVSYGSVDYDTPGITATVAGVETTITEMQEMTPEICEAWTDGLDVEYPDLWDSTKNAPKAFTSGTNPAFRYGSDLSLPEFSSNDQVAANWDTILSTTRATSGSAIQNINTDVPETYLKDNRDSSYYLVRKLADGKCWMTENLRLTWNAGDSVEISDGTYWKPHHATETVDTRTNWSEDTDTVIEQEILDRSIADAQKGQFRGSYYDHSVYISGSRVSSDGVYLLRGAHYNFNAATAGTGTWDVISTSVSKSICPAGWNLPSRALLEQLAFVTYTNNVFRGGNANTNLQDYQKINGAHVLAVSQAFRRRPLNITFEGRYNFRSIESYDTNGRIWTSTANSNNSGAIDFDLYDLYIGMSGDYKSLGFPVRCVAQ